MRNLKLTLAYDGTAYNGWQRQKGVPTVQEAVEQAIRAVIDRKVSVRASGRTDARVHALAQVCNFHDETVLDPEDLRAALNANLPLDVQILRVEDVPPDFDSNRHARFKRYRYRIDNRFDPHVFTLRYAHHVRAPLDETRMARAAQCLMGTHDFACFESQSPQRRSTVRTITAIEVYRHAHEVCLEVESNGFLYNMVRAIAGTLIVIGRGRWPIPRMRDILKSRDRKQAGQTAPARGLYLLRVTY